MILSVNEKKHCISAEWLTLETIAQVVSTSAKLVLSEESIHRITHCRTYLDHKLAHSEQLFYGINTGFGYLQNVQISKAQIQQLQLNLVQSHACGMGDEVPAAVVKLMLLLKIQSLAYGHSGVQVQTVQRLVDFYNQDILPVVYTQGSLGASGDLSPLSHLSLPLLGMGEVYVQGRKQPAQAVLEAFGWEPISLQSKEGIALINGTQFMSAYGVHGLLQAARLLDWADSLAALSVDAFDASLQPFQEQIHAIRPHPGQVQTAAHIRTLLRGSEISNRPKKQVQDPYSFRCVPQVHGASRGVFAHVQDVFLQEVNSVTDNPNIFPDEDLILSGGNFHGQPLALGFDYLSMAMAELGNISERRTYQLLSGQRELPLFLVKNPGLHSGLMIPQYTAAGMVSENKQLCTPASVDSITSSNGQEDHVSMGANAATKCLRVLHNLEKILAIELLTAAQALEFRRPLRTSQPLEEMIHIFRKQIPFNEADRVLATDMQHAVAFIRHYPAPL